MPNINSSDYKIVIAIENNNIQHQEQTRQTGIFTNCNSEWMDAQATAKMNGYAKQFIRENSKQ